MAIFSDQNELKSVCVCVRVCVCMAVRVFLRDEMGALSRNRSDQNDRRSLMLSDQFKFLSDLRSLISRYF